MKFMLPLALVGVQKRFLAALFLLCLPAVSVAQVPGDFIDICPTNSGNNNATFNIVGDDTVFVNTASQFRLRAQPQSSSSQYSKNWYVNGTLQKQGGSSGNTFTSVFQNADTLSAVVADCSGNTDTIRKVVYVDTPTGCPNTEFAASTYKIPKFSAVDLTDLSTNGPTGWSWSIRQINAPTPLPGYIYTNPKDSSGQNPTARFFRTGTYNVSLTASNIDCPTGQKKTKRAYIEVVEAQNICADQSSTDTTGILVDNGGADNDYAPINGPACTYSIAPCATEVTLNLSELDIRNNRAFLRIYDGNSADGKPLWNTSKFGQRGITGDLSQAGVKEQYTATSGNVYVEFSTGSNPEGSGFRLDWESENEGLGNLRSRILGDSVNCGGNPATFKGAANFNNNTSFNWYFDSTFNQGADGNGRVFSYNVDSLPGPDTAGLIVEHCGRFDTATKPFRGIQPTNPPDVEFDVSQTFGRVGATVTLTDQSEPCVKDREWTISPNTYEFTNGTNANSQSADVQFNAEGSYTVTLVDSNVGGTADTTKFGVIQIQEYCEPTVNSLKGDLGMNLVSIGTLKQASSVGSKAYSNFNRNATTPKLEQGATYNLRAERNLSLNTVNYKVWVDYNSNGQFEQDEVLAQSGSVSGNQWNEAITISKNRSVGTYQMRVAANFGSLSNDPCGNTYGEYEDYLIAVIPDTTSPEIRFTGRDTLSLPACSPSSQISKAAYALDNADGRVDDISYSGSVDTAKPGAYNVTYTYIDSAGNRSERDRVIEVLPDNNPPEFRLNGNRFITLSVNDSFTDPGVTQVTDPCTGIDTFFSQSFLDRNTLGVDSIIYTARDVSGNELQRKRFVELIDTTAPTFDLAGSSSITQAVSGDFEDPGLTNIDDNFWSSNDIRVTKNVRVNDAVVGDYSVTYMVEDGSGNIRQRSRVVQVRDQTPPQITKVSDTVQLSVFNKLQYRDFINVVDNYSAADLVEVRGTFEQQFPDLEATVLGTYTLNLVYEDRAGNRNAADIVVEVVDNEAPDISLRGPSYLRFERWTTTPYASVDSVTVDDNYFRDFQLTIDTAGSYFSEYLNDSLPGGVFEITYQAEDPAGNKSEEVTRVVKAVTPATGLADENASQHISVYPNPATDRVRVDVTFAKSQDYQVQLVNSLGKIVKEVESGGDQKSQHIIQLSDLAKGAYVVRVTAKDSIHTQQIIVQ
jgi:PKD repeat protein